MPDTASNSHDRDRARDSRFTRIDGFRDQERGQSAAPSTLSLSMMREAFSGLRSNTEQSTSSTEQRDELELSDPKQDRKPNAFEVENYSFHAVSESEGLGASSFSDKGAEGRITDVGSTEFFNYLMAIGG